MAPAFIRILLASLSVGAGYPIFAITRPNVLIVGEDADHDTVPRNSPVFKRMLNALSNELHDQGFSVFDKTAITQEKFT